MAIKITTSGKEYSPSLSVYIETPNAEVLKEISGMLRGLMCSIEGWGAIAGKTNEHFSENNPVKLSFSSVDNAHYFKECVDYYFSQEVLDNYLNVKKRVFK